MLCIAETSGGFESVIDRGCEGDSNGVDEGQSKVRI